MNLPERFPPDDPRPKRPNSSKEPGARRLSRKFMLQRTAGSRKGYQGRDDRVQYRVSLRA